MSKIARFAVLITALASLFAVLSSTAGAVTFTNSGGTNFHATGGPGTLTVTGATGNTSLSCQGATATGSAGMGAFGDMSGTVSFAPCTLIGLHTHTVCSWTFTPTVWHAPVSVTGSMHTTCTETLATSPFTSLCRITGATPVNYINPTGATPGKLTLFASGTLQVSNASDASCSSAGVPTGTTRTGDLSEQTINLTSVANSPILSAD